VPLLARWSRLFAATPQVDDDDQGKACWRRCESDRRIEQSSALLSVVSVDTDSRGPGAAARLAQAAIRPLVHLGLIISNAWSRRPGPTGSRSLTA
jgi:hypothetical protein